MHERLSKIFNKSDKKQYINKYEFYLKSENQACFLDQNNIFNYGINKFIPIDCNIYAYKLELKYKIPEGYRVKCFRGTKIKDIVLIGDNLTHEIKHEFEISKFKQVILEKIKLNKDVKNTPVEQKINWNGGYDACKKIWDKERKIREENNKMKLEVKKETVVESFQRAIDKENNKNILLQKAVLINGKIYNKDITKTPFDIYEINNYFGDKVLDIKSLEIVDSDSLELKAKIAIWLTGASGFAPKQFAGGKWVFLKDCATDHLKAILEDARNNKYNVEPWTIEVIKYIIKSRE